MTTKPTAEQLKRLRDIASMTSGGFSTSEHQAALTALLDAYEATQRPIEIDPAAPTDPAALPAFWDARRERLGKNASVCAEELRRALEHAAAVPVVGEPRYFIVSIKHGYVGNNCMFWRDKGMGYTGDLDDAGQFAETEAQTICRSSEKTCFMLPTALVDQHARRYLHSDTFHTLWKAEP